MSNVSTDEHLVELIRYMKEEHGRPKDSLTLTTDDIFELKLELSGRSILFDETRVITSDGDVGDFLAYILDRRLDTLAFYYKYKRETYKRQALKSICNLYSIEANYYNRLACVKKLRTVFEAKYNQYFSKYPAEEYLEAIGFIIEQNVLYGDNKTFMNHDGCTPLFISRWITIGYTVFRKDYLLSDVIREYPFGDFDISLAYDDWESLPMLSNRYYNVY